MAEFKFKMIETVHREREYTVDADTLEQAREFAEIGMTIREASDGRAGDIVGRDIVEQLA